MIDDANFLLIGILMYFHAELYLRNVWLNVANINLHGYELTLRFFSVQQYCADKLIYFGIHNNFLSLLNIRYTPRYRSMN